MMKEMPGKEYKSLLRQWKDLPRGKWTDAVVNVPLAAETGLHVLLAGFTGQGPKDDQLITIRMTKYGIGGIVGAIALLGAVGYIYANLGDFRPIELNQSYIAFSSALL